MEDRMTNANLKEQIASLEKNNSNYIEAMAGIEMLLTSNNNGTFKDSEISKKYNELKKKADELTNMTNEFLSMIE